MSKTSSKKTFVLCIENRDCDDLEKSKVYTVLADVKANEDGFLRVIDESGEDYLYPESYFVPVDLPAKAKAALDVKV